MRRFMLAGGIACAILLSHNVGAQINTTTAPAQPAAMPGQIVGSYRGNVAPVGNKIPSAAPQAGQSIAGGNGALQRPYDPSKPYDQFKGTNINTKQVLAPLVGPDGKPVKEPDALDRMSEKIKAFFVGTPPPARPTYAPGIARRTKDRIQHTWRRD